MRPLVSIYSVAVDIATDTVELFSGFSVLVWVASVSVADALLVVVEGPGVVGDDGSDETTTPEWKHLFLPQRWLLLTYNSSSCNTNEQKYD